MAWFFSLSREDPWEVSDLLASRYGWSLEYIECLPLEKAVSIIKMADKKTEAMKVREQWLMLLPLMQMGIINYISEKEYSDHVSGKDMDLRPADEIVAEARGIREELRRQNGSI